MWNPESGRCGARERAWLSWRELVAVVVFLALLGGLVFWTTTAVPSPAAELSVDLSTGYGSSSVQATERSAQQEAP